MKATLTQLQNSTGTLQAVLASRVPAKAAYAVTRLINAINPELIAFGTVRDRVFEEHGCVVVNKTWTSPPDKEEALAAALAEVAKLADDTTVELNAHPLDPEQFGNAEIPGDTFLVLGWALKED